MYYYLYKTTNLLNGKFYIGMHKHATNFDSKYYGSGVGLKEAIKKHGKENFTVEVLEYCDSLEQMWARERELVTEDLVKSNRCYNRHPGGRGGSPKGRGLGRPRRKGWVSVIHIETSETTQLKREDITSEWRPVAKGLKHSEEFRERCRQRNLRPGFHRPPPIEREPGCFWWNDSTNQKYAPTAPGPNWVRGMVKRTTKRKSPTNWIKAGYKYYNNGVSNLRLHDGAIVPEGFIVGKIKKKA